MQVGTDTLEIQHAKKASEIASQVGGANGGDALEPVFWNLTNHIHNLISTQNFPKPCETIPSHHACLKIYSFCFAHFL